MKNYTKYVVLFGCVFISTSLCVNLFIGNVLTYIYSYHYTLSRSDSFDLDPSWIYPMYVVARCFGSFIVDFIRKRFGLRLTSVLGIAIYATSLLLAHFAVIHSVWATILAFALTGFGAGVVALCNVVFISGWFVSRVGFVNALSSSFCAVGGIIINLVVTSYVNPNNLSPDRTLGEISFFSQVEIIGRIPSAFLLICGFSTGLQVFGFCFLRTPPDDITDDTPRSLQRQHGDNNGNERSGKTDNTISTYTTEYGCHPNEQRERVTSPGNRAISVTTDIPSHQNDENVGPDIPNQTDDVINKTGTTYMRPSEVLKSEKFYVLDCAATAITLGSLISGNYYKLFGQLWIHDDHFLAFLGSCMSLCTVLFFLAGGALIDFIGVKNALVVHLAGSAFSLSLWYFTARSGKWLYSLFTTITYCLHNSVYMVFSVSCLKLFGEPYFSTNFGLVQIPCILVSFAGPPVATFILASLGWFWLFFLCGMVSFLALFPVIFILRT